MSAVAVLSASAILPLLNMYEGVPVSMIGIWRYQLTVAYCIPISIIVWKKNKHLINLNEAITLKTLSEIVIGASCFTCGSFLLIYSSRYTIFSHAISLANAGGVFIIALNLISQVQVHKIEIIGTIIVIFGVVILLFGKLRYLIFS